ncbi:hypothetical protein DPMN_055997 [Dreissena polymorpha]|uniref:Uncharacterized protein n=1 Tax=Dreissena polymorpha TaxID=45954 RepID=A0A9D4CSL3_DREPO|nr:hypothetical protein DPMN_055997 [Dreissena polymorpha]
MGENSLRSIMKTIAERGDLTDRKTNHSARKTTLTTLLHNGFDPTNFQQLTGLKMCKVCVQSVNNSKFKQPCPTYYQKILTNTKQCNLTLDLPMVLSFRHRCETHLCPAATETHPTH